MSLVTSARPANLAAEVIIVMAGGASFNNNPADSQLELIRPFDSAQDKRIFRLNATLPPRSRACSEGNRRKRERPVKTLKFLKYCSCATLFSEKGAEATGKKPQNP
ncbi:hypothetical protein DRN85_08525 [Methanosarcinales archaeon]|nr:MAG: hypothetical protein DRN85_08525 [Methanosarcinales archaeon]